MILVNMEEELIKAVEKKKMLYDIGHPDYFKTKLKNEVWSEIAKEIGMTDGIVAKNLWEKLRHALRDALRRQHRCLKSGIPPSSTKRWKYQTLMSFLQPHMANKKLDTNLNDKSDDDNSSQDCEEIVEFDDVQVKIEAPDIVESENIEGQDEFLRATESPCSDRRNSSTRPPKKMKKDDDVLKQSLATPEQRSTESTEERKQFLESFKAPNDALYYFFMSMYESTKKMPPSSQYIIKNSIYQAVTEMEASLLNIEQPSHIQTTGHHHQMQSSRMYPNVIVHNISQEHYNTSSSPWTFSPPQSNNSQQDTTTILPSSDNISEDGQK